MFALSGVVNHPLSGDIRSRVSQDDELAVALVVGVAKRRSLEKDGISWRKAGSRGKIDVKEGRKEEDVLHTP